MRVAIVCIAPLRDSAVLGGTYSSSLAEALNARGVQAELWTKKSDEPPVTVKAPVLQVWRSGFMAWLDILRAVRKHKPDVVHLQYYFFLFGNGPASELSTLLLALAFIAFRTPFIVTLHDVPGKDQLTQSFVAMHKYRYPVQLIRAGLATLFALLGRAAHTLFVDSELLAQRLAEYGVSQDKIVVIPLWPLPSDPSEQNDSRAQLNIAAESCVVLFFGYATGYKGLEQLLAAFGLLENRNSQVRLVLAAGVHPKMGHTTEYGVYYRQLRAKAASLRAVRFVGFIHPNELGTYLSAADVGILPYIEYHGASGPLYHYLGDHRPVLVSSAIAANNPLLRTGVFRVTPEAIAQLIERFSQDKALRASVEEECEALRDSLFSDYCFDLTKDSYVSATSHEQAPSGSKRT